MKARQPRFKQLFSGREMAEEMAESAAVAWAEVISHLEDNSLLTSLTADTAKRYVLARVEHDFLYAEAMAAGPTITADSGGQYANMQWSAVGKLNEQIMKFEDALLIAPKASDGKLKRKSAPQAGKAAQEFITQPTAH